MKKLSLSNKVITNRILNREVLKSVINDNFSGFETKEGDIIKGSCASCDFKTCMNYKESDICPKKFKEFEKNISNRVCPTNAIHCDDNNKATIDSLLCIKCGLCIHRCPYNAIQFSIKNSKCFVNNEEENLKLSSQEEQIKQIAVLEELNKEISFDSVTPIFSSDYNHAIRNQAKNNPDIGEIIVRNTFINIGYICATKPAGNNHIRTEFFGEGDNSILVGESEIYQDTLSVCRRILDDLSVLISRNGFDKQDIIPLAVINGLPNKRTDFYEVISDINNVLGVNISTITYHILFMIQLFQVKIKESDLTNFVVNRDNFSLIDAVKKHLESIVKIDKSLNDEGNYQPQK